MLSPDTAGKRLELLREIVPAIRRLAVMVNLGFPAAVQEGSEAHAAASALGLEVVKLEIRRPQDIASSFESLKADALYVTTDALPVMLIGFCAARSLRIFQSNSPLSSISSSTFLPRRRSG